MGRRLPYVRTSTGKRVKLKTRDLEMLVALDWRGGMLPTSYLFEYASHKHRTSFLNRVNDLYHENNTPHHSPYLDHPQFQFGSVDADENELVHKLDDAAYVAMGSREEYAIRPGGPGEHQLMANCIYSSIEIQANKNAGLRFVHQHELLQEAGRSIKIEAKGVGELIPDGMFVLERHGKRILFFLEADRATEPRNTSSRRKSWVPLIRQYQELLETNKPDQLYKRLFNVNCGAVMLNFTTEHTRGRGMVSDVAETFKRGRCNYILTHVLPDFGKYFKPPDIMQLLDVHYQRAGMSDTTILHLFAQK